jgi:hypothetical protein
MQTKIRTIQYAYRINGNNANYIKGSKFLTLTNSEHAFRQENETCRADASHNRFSKQTLFPVAGHLIRCPK